MLRVVLKALILFAAGAGMVVLFGRAAEPWLTAKSPEDDYAAAVLMLDRLDAGEEDGLWFRRRTVDPDRVYRAIEAQLPYAFTMHCKTLQEGSTELTVEIENRASQEQAEVFAQGIVGAMTLDGLDDRAKLLALHDWLIVHCAYDLSVEDEEAMDGADYPFTAAGALIDGSAVCMGYARAYQMLCGAAGIEVFLVVSEGMNHAWNGIVLDGELLFIDCTYDDPVPDRPGEAIHEYFLVGAEKLRETHGWDEEFYAELGRRLYPGQA